MKLIPSLYEFIGDPMFGLKSDSDNSELMLKISKLPPYKTLVIVGNSFLTRDSLKCLKKIPNNLILVGSRLNIDAFKGIKDNVLLLDELKFKYNGVEYVASKVPTKQNDYVNIYSNNLISDDCSIININMYLHRNNPISMTDISTGTIR